MDDLANVFAGPWVVIWDINSVISQSDKIGGRSVTSSSSGGLNRIIADHGLIDLGFKGHPYTWNNGRVGGANIQAQQDHGFANDVWRLLFPEATIIHLAAIQSDHRPLLLKLYKSEVFPPRPFRFESMWTLDQSVIDKIHEAWNTPIGGSPLHQIVCSLKNTKLALKLWNKTIFGRVQTLINDTRLQIAANQDAPSNVNSLSRDKILQESLDHLLLKEQFLWKDKAKEEWLEEGDRNSRFFHVSTIIRRRRNHIEYIYNRDHMAVSYFEGIGQLFMDFYQDLFASSNPPLPHEQAALFPRQLAMQEIQDIADIPSCEEVRDVVFSMSNGKSLGSDGMSSYFFKFYWDIL